MPPKRKSRPAEIFISHSTQNGAFVGKLHGVLVRHKLKCFVSKVNIRGAQQWHDELGAALKRCDCFLLVLSPQAVKSKWVKRELLYALDQRHYEDRIVPVLYRDCDVDYLSWTLRSIEWIDYRGNFDAACARLLEIWAIKPKPTKRATRT
jgi:hypothetical protein